MIPWGMVISRSNFSRMEPSMPSSRRSNFIASLQSSRMTMLSPLITGIVLMRMSISRRPIRKLVRPSCGRRLSAMFSSPISLMREAMAGNCDRGALMISVRTPSTRQRTATLSSPGSMWMSEAPSSIARVKMSLTRRTIRASPAIERSIFSSSTSISSSSSPALWSLPVSRSRKARRTNRKRIPVFQVRRTKKDNCSRS
ncbi:hypothetical protein SDC9_153664 [bioreactor metagenome]|uniref:Uncharacterized protein n=1 Tax=bioreactor metagenome TaxID=1076179 RepID=A0A645EWI9_9ZZZZ